MKRSNLVNIIITSVCAYSMGINANVYNSSYTEKSATSTSCDVVLDFSNMGLSIINPNFISNPFIKTLALRHNSIKSFEENTFNSLPSLETLDLSNNELTAENLFLFGNSQALKSLTLDYNPESLSTVTAMPVQTYLPTESYFDQYDSYDDRRQLYRSPLYREKCSEDQYYTVNDTCGYYSELKLKYKYPNLTHLSIRKIFISSLASDWPNHFPKLCHLDMSENYFKKTSGEVFSRLPTSVTSLIMQNVKLTALDSSNLNNITHLNLNENKFETLSSHYCYENTLCLRNLTNLITLHIADCSITKIEVDAFKDTKKLNYLNMSSNQFEEIPDGAFKYLPALSHIDLSRNKFNVIPDFSDLKNLTVLHMDDIQNKWLFSTALESFSQLPTLEVLSLRSNGLERIPSSFLDKLPKLTELNLSHNNLATLPTWQSQHSLRRLSLGYNEIGNLEDILLEKAGSLELLNLQNNKFTEIKFKSLKHLPDNMILKL